MTKTIKYTVVDTSVGSLCVAYSADGIIAARLTDDENEFVADCADELDSVVEHDSNPPSALLAAVEGRLQGDVQLTFSLPGRTPFQRAVLEYVASIPRGEMRTYGEVALAVGHPGAARAVGEVMRTNRIPVLIPCHRVVRSGGDVGQYTPDPSIKRRLLIEEGALLPTR
ncbi:MAG: methylated-DNA-[protein]-cysteine S-methyltransferase [Chloroflexota bacterium]|jgi:O-6-methylguanine DNA methyltransferase|nr:methylated-DNA-[protein]-cysteine S-methyltransferase [Chloroflexota bacterium]